MLTHGLFRLSCDVVGCKTVVIDDHNQSAKMVGWSRVSRIMREGDVMIEYWVCPDHPLTFDLHEIAK